MIDTFLTLAIRCPIISLFLYPDSPPGVAVFAMSDLPQPISPHLPPARPRPLDARLVTPFVHKSVSAHTRRAYARVLRDFFGGLPIGDPAGVTPDDVRRRRDRLIADGRKPATVSFHLAVIRSFYEYLVASGLVARNPASTRLVSAPAVPEGVRGRALSKREVGHLLAGPDRRKPEGARDYALMLVMVRMGLRVSEACSLKRSQVGRDRGRWTLRVTVKGGRERTLPLPDEVKEAVDSYLALDRGRRRAQRTDGPDAYVFQPLVNYRTLEFARPLTPQTAWNVVQKWAEYARLGRVSPHDLRRTVITQALDQGLSYRQVQMMSGHKDPKTVMRYDHGRENLDHNAINFVSFAGDNAGK